MVQGSVGSGRMAAFLLVAGLLLGGCASKPSRAPVEDRPVGGRTAPPASATAPAAPAPGTAVAEPSAKPLPPGSENAGKPGYYTVKPGDALIRIGLEFGQNWRDIARWNGLDNPNVIEVGQVLRVVPPAPESAVAVARPVAPVAPGRVDARPPAASAATPSPAASGAAPAAVATTPPPATPAARGAEDDIAWGWPASGSVVTPFEEGRNKGMAIGGKAGDPVLAAADGRVVYAGSGLRGYGNLVIVKHNATYLTAYAHNQTLHVREDQVVKKGQRIAEMGSSDAERVQLHFEIRRQGRPVDPARLLPTR